jgi:hypothetical protein
MIENLTFVKKRLKQTDIIDGGFLLISLLQSRSHSGNFVVRKPVLKSDGECSINKEIKADRDAIFIPA